jgi:hypothetical protein
MALQDIGVRAVVEGLANFKTSIDEMTAKTNSYTSQTASGMKAAQFQMDEFAKSIGTTSTKIGIGMAAMGASITAALGLSVKEAANEEQAFLRLGNALKNVGVDFESVKKPLDDTIMAMEKMSAVSHDQLYSAFTTLIQLAGNYDDALKLLPAALDISAARGIDLATASNMVARASEGSGMMLKKYLPNLKDNATQMEILTEVNKVYGGSAEAMGKSAGSAMTSIKNSISALMESIGKGFLPLLTNVSKIVSDTIDKFRKWSDENPTLTKVIANLALGLGVVLTVLGGLILALPSIIAGVAALGAVFHVALGPIGLISLAIAGLIALGITLYQNWDKVSVFLNESWENIKIAFAEAVKFIINTVLMPFIEYYSKTIGFIAEGVGKLVGFFDKDLGNSIQAFAEKLKNSRGEITAWADNIITDSQINKTALQAEKLAEAVASGVKEVAISPEMQAKMDDFADTATKIGEAWKYANTEAGKLGLTMNDMIGYLLAQGHSVDELKAKYTEYGDNIQKWATGMGVSLNDVSLASKNTSGSMVLDAEKFTAEAKKLTEEYVKDQKSALDDVLSSEKNAYQKRIDNIDKILQAQLDAYDKELAGLNDQLSEIDNLQKESDDNQKKSELELAISTEYDLKKKADLNRELDDLILNSNNETWQKQRQTQLESLIANEDDVDVKKDLQAEYNQYLIDLDIETQRTTLENQISAVEDKKTLAQEEADYAKSIEDKKLAEFTANIATQKAALDTQLVESQARYDQELIAFKAKNTILIDETVAFVKRMNEELAKVKPVVTQVTNVTNVTTNTSDSSTVPLAGDPGFIGPMMATGGKVTRPSWHFLGEGGESEYVVPESKLSSFISRILGNTSSATQKLVMPVGSSGGINNSRSTNYNINANYSKTQSEASLRLDLEAIAMMARS